MNLKNFTLIQYSVDFINRKKKRLDKNQNTSFTENIFFSDDNNDLKSPQNKSLNHNTKFIENSNKLDKTRLKQRKILSENSNSCSDFVIKMDDFPINSEDNDLSVNIDFSSYEANNQNITKDDKPPINSIESFNQKEFNKVNKNLRDSKCRDYFQFNNQNQNSEAEHQGFLQSLFNKFPKSHTNSKYTCDIENLLTSNQKFKNKINNININFNFHNVYNNNFNAFSSRYNNVNFQKENASFNKSFAFSENSGNSNKPSFVNPNMSTFYKNDNIKIYNFNNFYNNKEDKSDLLFNSKIFSINKKNNNSNYTANHTNGINYPFSSALTSQNAEKEKRFVNPFDHIFSLNSNEAMDVAGFEVIKY